ncbi:MAG: hypothetical protein MN733_00605 [Nitrososphaera sp.]|nr:hypothetical protein [Nitrososphaera sp.]
MMNYLAIAQVFNDNRPNPEESREVKYLWRVLQRDMADIFEWDDSSFERGEFSTACNRPRRYQYENDWSNEHA